jgi:Zn-dependent protease/predicted transcriptional regulator
MRSIRAGSVLGFEIRLDYSWFVIFFLILWTFTAALFPTHAPGRSTAEYALMGLAGSLLFFASLLAHELSHCVVARARGIPVEGITLFVFGGMARAGGESENPSDEFLIAGVGPLASLLIAILLGAVGWYGARAGWSIPVVVVLTQVAVLNLVLAIFNLLPGFPMDGGRILRAAVWKVTGSLTRATKVAAGGGRWIGLALMLLGVLQLFAGNLVGGIWLVLIGAFLRGIAQGGYQQVLLTSTLQGARIEELMTPDPVTVPADLSLDEFVEHFLMQGRHLGYPVMEGGSPVGLISLHAVRAIAPAERSRHSVREAMVPAGEDLVVESSAEARAMLEKLQRSSTGRLLVVDEGRLVGIVTRSDLSRWLERALVLEGK